MFDTDCVFVLILDRRLTLIMDAVTERMAGLSVYTMTHRGKAAILSHLYQSIDLNINFFFHDKSFFFYLMPIWVKLDHRCVSPVSG